MKTTKLLAMMMALTLSALAQSYDAGKEYDTRLPGSGAHLKVYIPANYTPDYKWPLILFYHGMDGSPTTDCMVRHCEGADFIIIGMSYCETQPTQMTPEQQTLYIEKERKNFAEAVAWVQANLSLDPERVFLGGISKGGWTTSFVGERELKRLAGLIILLAGRQRGAVPAAQAMDGLLVYIGVGESDPNLLPGAQAAGFYRRCGANVSFEEFEGIGHQAPSKAARLMQWLEAHGALSHPWLDVAVKEARKAEYKGAYENALAMTDKTATCRALRALLDDPRLMVACGATTAKAIEQKLIALSKDDPLSARALAAEQMFYDLVWKEWNMKTFEDSRVIVEGYSRLSRAGSQTRYDDYAAKGYERLRPVYESAQKQMEQMKAAQQKERSKPAARPQMRNSSGTGGMSVF
ncbi:MAG: hypothetical protein PHO37_00375 [Kiritimatiellae bacterium]|nr:hypothetical protein [Kiritimatiellia bacterium]